MIQIIKSVVLVINTVSMFWSLDTHETSQYGMSWNSLHEKVCNMLLKVIDMSFLGKNEGSICAIYKCGRVINKTTN